MASVSQFESRYSGNSGLANVGKESASAGRAGALTMERASSRDGNPNPNSGGNPAPPSSSQRGGPLLEKFRTILKAREDEFNGSLSNSQVVSLYRDALSELTFNSKPVITDLTIIAGELSYLAKEIANTVCNHILEVPIDQKLPSLYLLDSIVKNIGGDYVEYFSSRLAEVFIKSYRQVDPSLYNSMKHLFRTWRDVFHPRPLHVIESELKFAPTTLPSSGAASSRQADNHVQRPAHSIHVNPKYLAEARHQFEQASMAEVSNSEINEELSSPETADRANRSLRENSKLWQDVPRVSHGAHVSESTNSFVEHGYGQKPSAVYGDRDFSLSPPRMRSARPPSPAPRAGIVRPSSPVSRLRTRKVPSPPVGGIGMDQHSRSPSRSVMGRDPRGASPVAGIGRDPRVAPPSVSNVVRDPRVPSPPPATMGREHSPSRAGGRGAPLSRTSFARSSSSGIGMARRNERTIETENGWEKPWGVKVEGDSSRPHETTSIAVPQNQKNGYAWRPQTMAGALIDAYGNYRGQSQRAPLAYLPPSQDTEIANSKMPSRTWQYSEEEEYSWEDMNPSVGSYDKGNDATTRKEDFSGDLPRAPVVDRNKRTGVDPAVSDDLPMNGTFPYKESQFLGAKDSEEHQSFVHSTPNDTSQNDKEMAFDRPNLFYGIQGSFGQQRLSNRSPYTSHQNHSSFLSSNIKQYQGSGPASSVGLTSFSLSPMHASGHLGAQLNEALVGPSSKFPLGNSSSKAGGNVSSFPKEPVSFDSLPPATVTGSNLSVPQMQQSQRPISPAPGLQSVRPSLNSVTPLAPSASPQQQAQFQPGHPQATCMKPVHTHSQAQSTPSFPSQQLPPNQHILPQQQTVNSQGAKELQQPSSDMLSANQMRYHLPQEGQPISTSLIHKPSQPQEMTQQSLQAGGEMNVMSKTSPSPLCFGRGQPPLPPGPPPNSSQISTVATNSTSLPSSLGNVQSLLSSLMAQGIISATVPSTSSLSTVSASSSMMQGQPTNINANASGISALTNLFSAQSPSASTQTSTVPELQPVCDPIGTRFTSDILKTRHEHVIRSLYEELPRQCTACGLRFKLQEDHSNHMDWHVTRNRSSKNKKQKGSQTVSRKWFVNLKEWLSGTDAITSEFVPPFSPMETFPDKKDDDDFSVPADENQSVCALCGELFDDFYSDERDEWMYKGAVYMNAPNGDFEGMDKSELGPIVHAKCRSETVGPSGDSENRSDGEDGSESIMKKARYS
eukprot:TRINITY_DN1422_c0_g2_i1.p1 TRINITY_DN1422_c0_g2~~TRINITY_DN1422_c0_g2_i1.p1  ORF type:complete len:1235 (-),score=274.29 TRINITY_DN1422_c0_g2_i1:346-4050(-)